MVMGSNLAILSTAYLLAHDLLFIEFSRQSHVRACVMDKGHCPQDSIPDICYHIYKVEIHLYWYAAGIFENKTSQVLHDRTYQIVNNQSTDEFMQGSTPIRALILLTITCLETRSILISYPRGITTGTIGCLPFYRPKWAVI